MKLKELGRIITGKTPPTGKPELWDGDVPFITVKDIQSGKYITSTERRLSQEGLRSAKKITLPPGAVCVSCVGTLGYVGMTAGKCVTSQQICSIVPNENTCPDYIYYLMKSLWGFFKENEGRSNVTSMFGRKRFADIEVNVPEPEVQKRIAAVLSPFDEFSELNRKRMAILEKQLRLIFGYFTSGITDRVKLSDICEITFGKHNIEAGNENYFGGGIKWLRAQDITGYFIDSTSRTLTEEGYNSNPKSSGMFLPDTIVLSTAGSIGRTAIITEPMCANSGVANIRPSDSRFLPYIFIFLLSSFEYLNSIAFGSVAKTVTADRIKSLEIPLGTEKETDRIIRLIQPYFDKLRILCRQEKIINQSRDTAISKLFEKAHK